jgi:predicted enzyme related to lactoylglutathione lyase
MNKQSNHIDYLEFPGNSVEAVAKNKKFYFAVFGWSFKDWGNDYIDTSSSGLACGFNADPEHCPNRPLAVIYTSDLLAARAAILAVGGVLTKEIFEFPGGKRFHFTDPAGNELAVWSEK